MFIPFLDPEGCNVAITLAVAFVFFSPKIVIIETNFTGFCAYCHDVKLLVCAINLINWLLINI